MEVMGLEEGQEVEEVEQVGTVRTVAQVFLVKEMQVAVDVVAGLIII